MKQHLFLIISVIGLLGLMTLTVFTKTQTQVASNASGGSIDTLPYLIGNHALGQSSDPKSVGITNYVVGNAHFMVKSGNGRQYEYRTWDATNIYLNQDTSVGGVNVGGTEPNSYTFSPGRGIWLKRHMAVGESFVQVPNIAWFDDCKQVGTWPTWQYTVTLEDHKPYNVGGSLGTQDVIIMKYDYGSGYERFYYSKDWGWVRWEEFDQNGTAKRSGNFNKPADLFPIRTSCGTPNPNIPLPVSSPKPTKSPKPTPTVTPGGNHTPTPTPQVSQSPNSCPEPGNPACYDCNFDGVVNILDFSCFSKNYGK